VSQPTDDATASSRERLLELLQLLEKRGLTQQEIALRTKVPPQYLSDVKTGRRTLTELYARRLSEEFGVDHAWLLGRDERPIASRAAPTTPPAGTLLRLPVLSRPITGNPNSSGAWDGTYLELSGAAAAQAAAAESPYIWRFNGSDYGGRLRPGDLILVSQEGGRRAGVNLVRYPGGIAAARREKSGEWTLLTAVQRPRDKLETVKSSELVGIVLGIVWGGTA
jgi:transcriptional regulator with XRE-family HTH domain